MSFLNAFNFNDYLLQEQNAKETLVKAIPSISFLVNLVYLLQEQNAKEILVKEILSRYLFSCQFSLRLVSTQIQNHFYFLPL